VTSSIAIFFERIEWCVMDFETESSKMGSCSDSVVTVVPKMKVKKVSDIVLEGKTLEWILCREVRRAKAVVVRSEYSVVVVVVAGT